LRIKKIPGDLDPGFHTLYSWAGFKNRHPGRESLPVSDGRRHLGSKSCRAQHTPFPALYPLYRFFLLDSPSLTLGEVVVMPSQNRLNVFLKIFAKLANLFFYVFFRFGLIAYQ
jgi:hypothetical protein